MGLFCPARHFCISLGSQIGKSFEYYSTPGSYIATSGIFHRAKLKEPSRCHNKLFGLLSEIRSQFQFPETKQVVSETATNQGQSPTSLTATRGPDT